MLRSLMAVMGMAACAFGSITAHAQVYFLERLTSPHPEAGSGFGATVAGGAMGLLVAQPGASYAGSPSVGAAYLYNAGDPNSPFELRPQQTIANARYGAALSNRNDILVAAPGGSADASSAARGVVEAWRYVPAYSWARYGSLSPPVGERGTGFGQSIASSSFQVLVGFPGRLDGARHSGAAMLFDEGVNGWTYGGSYTSAADGMEFGTSVALSNTRTFIGEPGYAIGNGASGNIAYYLNGQPAATLVPNDGAAQAYGGYAIVAFGQFLLVGVPYPLDASQQPMPGRVYIYQADAGYNYTFWKMLSAPDGHAGDGFGNSIDTYQHEVMVGAPGMSVGALPEAGAAWLFDSIGFDFTPNTKIVSTFPSANGHFGQSVSMAYGFSVGAPGEPDDGSLGAGAVYRFMVDYDVIFKGTFDFN